MGTAFSVELCLYPDPEAQGVAKPEAQAPPLENVRKSKPHFGNFVLLGIYASANE